MKPEALPEQDHEGRMAKSELYRAAKHSMKLFQMIQDGQNLEGWVQGKITMAADYLDTVYHYMEYQMKFGAGEQAAQIDDITGDAEGEESMDDTMSDMEDEKELAESYEQKLKSLLEGKVKKMKEATCNETAKGESCPVHGVKECGMYEAKIEKSGVRATDKKKGKVEKTERKIYFVKLEKDNKVKGVTTQADEGEREGDVRDRVKRENMGWKVASIRVKDSIDEASDIIAKKKTAASMTKKEPMKKAVADKKAGPQKGVNPFAKKDEKTEESLVKATVKKVVEAKKKAASKPDFLDINNNGDKKEPMKKAAADKKAGPQKGVNPFAKKDEKKETVKESADLDRMKQFMKRLNG
jgi:hypothetical protein